ncbi:alpha-ketoacid dehydrogenase subunit beta [Desulfoprunum benzoelyticum]|uniref:Pyruvate/2-oxoglutarate/acetoin dehydrogenase E1 component n=1 Tax=Desulfoprunum benzoelyticum TaxID=1506996 RepID=A0A840UNF3_9BACT|nr:alpha-ketoacid dehydrogenase subunit beta [Desulfoprunum benzoelyticum]MBB5347165.1 pyruvate/2-oxoglutarate/acetoin dehydrogenase E1 component [Desulfoprunum benzoelyticum]MBM9531367.1 alpha-ketoacid dehydrogenase subunit beta [Desulfoprunum benzoelyticum]
MTTTAGTMRKLTYREAVREAIREAMHKDERVFLMGEDVGRYGGCFAVSKGLLEEFGPERIRDTPLAESGFTGAGIGAALGGMRPIVEIMTGNFSLLAADQIINTAAVLLHMSGGQFNVPVVIRLATGGGRQVAAQHSRSLEGWFAHIPGIKVLAPATVNDARGMLWTALEDPDPVLIFENSNLYNMEGPLAVEAGAVDIDRARVRRDGRDITIISYGASLFKALEAAEILAKDGIEVEVVDLRTLRPLDEATFLASVARTHRALVVDEGWRSGSLAAEISARIMEGAFYDLDAPVARLCTAEVPLPYAKHLEEAALPQVAGIVALVKKMVGGHG